MGPQIFERKYELDTLVKYDTAACVCHAPLFLCRRYGVVSACSFLHLSVSYYETTADNGLLEDPVWLDAVETVIDTMMCAVVRVVTTLAPRALFCSQCVLGLSCVQHAASQLRAGGWQPSVPVPAHNFATHWCVCAHSQSCRSCSCSCGCSCSCSCGCGCGLLSPLMLSTHAPADSLWNGRGMQAAYTGLSSLPTVPACACVPVSV